MVGTVAAIPGIKKETMKQHNYNDIPGCVIIRRAHATGTMVAIFHNEQAGIKRKLPWSAKCMEHGRLYVCKTKTEALESMADVIEWCDKCAGL